MSASSSFTNSAVIPDMVGETGTGPALAGQFGNDVALPGGNSVTADETYIRESILKPNAKVVASYAAVMPTYTGLITEDKLILLGSYVKALGQEKGGEAQKVPQSSSAGPNLWPTRLSRASLTSITTTASAHGCSPSTTSASPSSIVSPSHCSFSWAARLPC